MHHKHGRCHYPLLGVVDSLVVAGYPRTSSAIPAALPAAHNILSLTLRCSDYPVCIDRVLPWGTHGRRRAPRKGRLLVVLGRREMQQLLLVSGWDVVKRVLIDMRGLDLDYRFGIASWIAGKPYCNNRWQP